MSQFCTIPPFHRTERRREGRRWWSWMKKNCNSYRRRKRKIRKMTKILRFFLLWRSTMVIITKSVKWIVYVQTTSEKKIRKKLAKKSNKYKKHVFKKKCTLFSFIRPLAYIGALLVAAELHCSEAEFPLTARDGERGKKNIKPRKIGTLSYKKKGAWNADNFSHLLNGSDGYVHPRRHTKFFSSSGSLMPITTHLKAERKDNKVKSWRYEGTTVPSRRRSQWSGNDIFARHRQHLFLFLFYIGHFERCVGADR